MGKYILLIGVSTGEIAAECMEPSPTISNLYALKQALLTTIEDLREDQVITLLNPDRQQMGHAIALMTYQCRHNDLCLIYYTGCGVIDAQTGKFYLSANDTYLDDITATAISSDYIHQALPSSQTNLNRVIVLDCMWGTTPTQGSLQVLPMAIEQTHLLKARLADCGCYLFTALGNNVHPWPMAETGLSLYTQCLIEGINTGLADIDADGGISVNDLKTYMAEALAETGIDIFPMALLAANQSHHGVNTPLISVQPYSPEREYRRSVEEYVHRGHISTQNRNILEFLRYQLGITLAQSQTIEADVLTPYIDHQENCDRYRHALIAALELESPLGNPLRKWLRHLQHKLSLNHEDIANIEAQIAAQTITQNNSVQALQTLPRWLTPVDRPQLPAHVFNQNGT